VEDAGERLVPPRPFLHTQKKYTIIKEREMGKNKIFVAVLTGVCTLLLFWSVRADQQAEKEAVQTAETWLAQVDEGKYSESWEAAAELFKNAVTKEQWVKALTNSRKPLGRLVTRKIKSKQYTTSLPGVPDGEYVVIQYETSFENKKIAIETVTPMLDKDGKWRVSGYYIK
jgi:predicted SnoaL-like aldol condensation-catalyzing enzyme